MLAGSTASPRRAKVMLSMREGWVFAVSAGAYNHFRRLKYTSDPIATSADTAMTTG